MKKHSRVSFLTALCLAGFIGQWTAFGASTNSVWDVTSISAFKAGKIHAVRTNSAVAVIFTDGTASVQVGGGEFDGNYTNNTKKLTLTIGAGGLAALKNEALALIQAQVPSATLTVKKVKFTPKIKLSTTGVPVKATDTVTGKGCEVIAGKNRCKSFTLKTLWTNWTLVSGTDF